MKIIKSIIGTIAILMGILQVFGLFIANKVEMGLYMKLIQPLMPFMFIMIGIGFFRKRRINEDYG